MDPIHLRMDTIFLDRAGDILLVIFAFTKVDKGIEHPEGVVISPNIETFLVESIHSCVVTVISKQDKDKK